MSLKNLDSNSQSSEREPFRVSESVECRGHGTAMQKWTWSRAYT